MGEGRGPKAILDSILRDAAENSGLARGADLEGLAWYYVGIIQAVLNLPQAGASRSELERMIDTAMFARPNPIVHGR